jgi:HAD superfamily hydrolase (TIGR01509 family)
MRAIIFDMDGVLVDSEGMHEAAIRAACEKAGAPPPLPDWQEYVGLGDREVFAKVYVDAGRTSDFTEAARDRMMAEKERQTTRMIATGESWSAQAGAVELVRAASMRGPAAVCSGSRAFEVLAMLDAMRVLRLLHETVTADICARTKPDPMPYLIAAEKLGVSPSECVVIEDTAIGIRAAKGAGMACVAVEHTSPREKLLAAGADTTIARIADLSVEKLEAIWAGAASLR